MIFNTVDIIRDLHFSDVIMSIVAPQINNKSTIWPTACLGYRRNIKQTIMRQVFLMSKESFSTLVDLFLVGFEIWDEIISGVYFIIYCLMLTVGYMARFIRCIVRIYADISISVLFKSYAVAISQNAPPSHRNMHMGAHSCYKIVHCGLFDALWDLRYVSISALTYWTNAVINCSRVI